MRSVALDVHRSFCEIAIAEGGDVRHAGKIETTPEQIELFAQSLASDDEVVLEATGGAMEIASIIRPHVARVVVANAAEVRAISHARVKSDRFDAATLARLLSADMLDEVWIPDETTRILRRRIARRAALVRQRTRTKNEVHAVVMRCLLGRPPASDLFGLKGRDWLQAQQLPEEERETVDGCLGLIDFLTEQTAKLDQAIARQSLSSPQVKRLMTIPGVDVTTAAALMAAIGEISRFDSPRKLVAYLGLDPKVRQSGDEQARHGHISKRGNAQARCVLVEAAWIAVRSPGPLRAFGQRVRSKRGSQIAAVAVARKLTVLCWHMLTKEEDYAFARASLVRKKMRKLERAAGAAKLATRHGGSRISASAGEREAEQQLARQSEHAYRRLIADWKASGKEKGASIPSGRASSSHLPEEETTARQETAPDPAL